MSDFVRAWLIAASVTEGGQQYFCGDGDWCDNPNHAHKFKTALEANTKAVTMKVNQNALSIQEHLFYNI